MTPIGLYVQLVPQPAVSADPAGYPIVAEANQDGYDFDVLGLEGLYYNASPTVITASGTASGQVALGPVYQYVLYVLEHIGNAQGD